MITSTIIFAGFFSWWRTQKSKLVVESLKIFPIKSCSGISIQESNITPYGLEYDRNWLLIYEESKNFITQRQDPKMCLIDTMLKDGKLSVKAPDMEELFIGKVEDYKDSEKVQVKVWKDTVSAKDCGDTIADWFSKFLSRRVRLVAISPDFDRPLKPSTSKEAGFFTKGIHFQDSFPIHLATQSSLKDLQSTINDRKLVIDIFRANIVINGDSFLPWVEDEWKTIKIGDIKYYNAIPCSRCTMPNIDPDTSKVYEEPRNTLIQKRTKEISPGKPQQYFGIQLIPETIGKIKVGQTLEVLDFKN